MNVASASATEARRRQSAGIPSAFTLVSHVLCPYVQRAAIVLAEKGVAFERRFVDLSAKPAWFLEVSPLGKTPVLLVDDADLAVAKVLQRFAPPVPRPPAGVDRAARVAATAQLDAGVAVGFNVYVGERARIGARGVLHPGVYVGDDVVIGDDCELFPNVVVRERCSLGHRVVAHAVAKVEGFLLNHGKHGGLPELSRKSSDEFWKDLLEESSAAIPIVGPKTFYITSQIPAAGHRLFQRAIADYLKRERAYVEATGTELSALAPFRKNLMPDEA